MSDRLKVILFANTDWYLFNFRLPLAEALQARGYDVVFMSPAGSYTQKLVERGFRWIEFSLNRRSMNPLRELVTIWRIACIYRVEQPSVVHHFTIKCVLYGSIAARLAGIRRVLNAVTGLGHIFIDQTAATRLLRPFIKLLYKFALRKTTIIFQNPDDQHAFISSLLVKSWQCRLIRGSGVNVQKFCPSQQARDRHHVHIVFAGRLLWSKGLGELMQAIASLPGTNREAYFTIAGEEDPGNPTAVPLSILRQWREMKGVCFVGNQQNMVGLLQQADIVVLPSYREGVPRVLLEAAACGKPLIATNVPGCREIVKDGVNGLLVPVKDIGKLVRALVTLINNAELREEMGRQSRVIACTEFSEELVIDQTVEMYPIKSIAAAND